MYSAVQKGTHNTLCHQFSKTQSRHEAFLTFKYLVTTYSFICNQVTSKSISAISIINLDMYLEVKVNQFNGLCNWRLHMLGTFVNRLLPFCSVPLESYKQHSQTARNTQ